MLSYDRCNKCSDKSNDCSDYHYDRRSSYYYTISQISGIVGGVNTKLLGKYIYQNITEKRLRTLLIIVSIAISASLYFASISISDTMVKVRTNRWRASLGYTDIQIQAWWESPSRYFNQELSRDLEDYFEYSIGTISGYGLYQYEAEHSIGVNLWGIHVDELNQITEVGLSEQLDLYPFTGKKIIIGRDTAKKYGLQSGDAIPLIINGIKQKFKICAVADREGPFIGDGETVCGVIPQDTISSLYNVRGKIDHLYIKLKNPANKEQMLQILDRSYPLYHVSEPFTKQEIRAQNNRIRMPFLALTIILSFMSIYIINATFKVITYERLPNIGTFRSIGARKNQINIMLLIESLIYGSAGGILGSLLGVFILYLMSIFTMPSWEDGYKAAITFDPKQLIVTFLLSVLLCLISSLKPILGINKIPVKDIILNAVKGYKKSKITRAMIGAALLCFGAVAPVFIHGNYSIYINTICIVGVIAAVVMMIPFLVKLWIRLFARMYTLLFGNVGSMAVKNLRENRSVNGSISLLAIGISCVLFVNTLSFSTLKELVNYYDNNTFEIYMQAKDADMTYLQAVRGTPGVKEVTKVMGIGGIEIVSKGDIIGLTHGIDTGDYLSYNDLQLTGNDNRKDILDLLDKGRGILITNRLRDRFHLQLGEKLQLRAWGKISDYTIVGFFDSIENSGNYGIVSEKYMKLDMGWKDTFYSTIFIKTDKEPEGVVESLKTRFAKQQPFIKTMKDMKNENIRYNQQLFLIAKGFSVITMFAGILGIFNNLMISFIHRRRELAMYRCVGMSKPQTIFMILMEALTMGLIGSATGILSGVLMLISGAGLLKSLEMDINLHYSGLQIILSLIFGICIPVIASIWPGLKSSKLNLMEAIKYE